MNINLNDYNKGDIFQIEGDERWFKCCEIKINKYYVYGYKKKTGFGEGIVWRLDYSQARKLAKLSGICIEFSRIIYTVKDNIFIRVEDMAALKNTYGVWLREGIRYIAEAKIVYPDTLYKEINGYVIDGKSSNTVEVPEKNIRATTVYREMIRTSSACVDNVAPKVINYIPEMACKRAVIKAIIDVLNLEDIVEDFYESIEHEAPKEIKPPKKKDTKITKTQMEMIKKLLKLNKKKFIKKKYEKMTGEDANKEIEKLKPKKNNE